MEAKKFEVPAGYYEGVAQAAVVHLQAVIKELEQAGITDPVEVASLLNATLTGSAVSSRAPREDFIRHIGAPGKLVQLLFAQIEANPDPVFVEQAFAKIEAAREQARKELLAGIVTKKIG